MEGAGRGFAAAGAVNRAGRCLATIMRGLCPRNVALSRPPGIWWALILPADPVVCLFEISTDVVSESSRPRAAGRILARAPGRVRAPVARWAPVALVCVAASCAPAPAPGVAGLAPPHAYWRADDRLLVTDFRELSATASDRRFVYAAGRNGVLVYDHRVGRWEAPLTLEDGFPRADPPIALEVDPFTGILWMVGRTGTLWAHDVALRGEWRRVGTLPGAPPARLVPHEGSLWVLTATGWFESAAGGAPPVRRSAVPAAVRGATATDLQRLESRSPGFRSTGSSLTIDEYLRRWEITGAAPTPDPSRWWLSTWGGGLYEYDDRMLDARPLRYGSIGRGVSAIAIGRGGDAGTSGYWFGGDGMSGDRGVAHADAALQRWSWHEAGRGGAPRSPVHGILETDAGVFVGAEDGLYRLRGETWTRLTDFDALPSPSIRALVAGAGSLWVGTDRGLARIVTEAGGGVSVQGIDATIGARVNALAAADSMLWIATDRGLWRLNMRSGAVAQPPIADARLRGRVVGVAWDDDVLYALAESTLLAYDGSAWSAPLAGASIGSIGRPTHLAVLDGIVWIAGSTGALATEPLGGAQTVLSVPRDIPEGPVRQVLPIAGGVWLATPAGALLIRLE